MNNLHPDNMVGAISYVHSVDDNLPGDLEVATVTTLEIKNIHVQRDLADVDIPVELFEPGIFSKEIEKICKKISAEAALESVPPSNMKSTGLISFISIQSSLYPWDHSRSCVWHEL